MGDMEKREPESTTTRPMFGEPEIERGRTTPVVWIASAATLVVVLASILFVSLKKPAPVVNGPLPLDPYAANLALSGLQMSESTSLSGGKSTYIDGHIRNTGKYIVTAATAQVFFRNELQMPPEIETVPVMLIRTHEPYVDTEPISTEPVKPGDEREFRLTFESIGTNWNQQIPEIHLVRVTLQ